MALTVSDREPVPCCSPDPLPEPMPGAGKQQYSCKAWPCPGRREGGPATLPVPPEGDTAAPYCPLNSKSSHIMQGQYSLWSATPRSHLLQLLAGRSCSPPFSDPISRLSLGCSGVELGVTLAGNSRHSSLLSSTGTISRKRIVHGKAAKVSRAC